jgi:hypothetical protein
MMSRLGAGVNLCTNWQFTLMWYWYCRQGFLLTGTRARKCGPSSWAIASGVFQSMDALRFWTVAAAWLIRGQNRASIVASIVAPWAEARVRTVVHLFGFWHCRLGPLPPGGSIGFRKGLGDCLPEGGLGGARDDPGGGHLLQIYNWMRRSRWFVGPRRWPGIPLLCGQRRRLGRPGELSRSGPPS